MKRTITGRIVTGAVAAGGAAAAIAVGAVSPAFAATETTAVSGSVTNSSVASSSGISGDSLAQLQALGEAAISARLASLHSAITRVQGAVDAGSADQQLILARFNDDLTGLTALDAKIAADTSQPTALSDVRSIYTSYRIYAVQLPQAIIALGADRMSTTTIPKLQNAYNALKQLGANASQLAQMLSDIDAASSEVDDLSAQALAVTPSQYNGDTSVMTPLRQRLVQAVLDAKAAVEIGQTLVGDLPTGSASS